MALENKAQKTKREAMEALPRIVEATQSETGYTFCSDDVAAYLVKNGYIEQNSEIKNEAGALATRATEKGIAAIKPKEEEKVTTENAAKQEFEILDNVELPKATRTGGGGVGNTVYPFDKLAVGQSFFAAGKEAKKFASTVSSANSRYAVEVKNEDGTVKMRTNRKGNSVAETIQERQFKSAAFEKDGVKGVLVKRVK